MTGDCPNCLINVDGMPAVRSCCTPARAGMAVKRETGRPSADVDFLAINDYLHVLMPVGFYHKAFIKPKSLALPYETTKTLTKDGKEIENIATLKGYQDASGKLVALSATGEDEYEVLAKAIGLYNSANYWFTKKTWPLILKELKPAKKRGLWRTNLCYSGRWASYTCRKGKAGIIRSFFS